jgi:hypothetical protein
MRCATDGKEKNTLEGRKRDKDIKGIKERMKGERNGNWMDKLKEC